MISFPKILCYHLRGENRVGGLMSSERRFFIVGQFYHIMTKSIAGYQIFRFDSDYERMLEIMQYYAYENTPVRFSYYHKFKDNKRSKNIPDFSNSDKLINIAAYCFMPTHIHLLLIPLKENSISIYIRNMLNSYTRYFNTRNNRKGPLWQGRFKSVPIENDEQLIHLTRYIHLNPTSSGIVDKPEDWEYSSYGEYIGKSGRHLCNFKDYININPESYKEFVESRKDYQKELSIIKHLVVE